MKNLTPEEKRVVNKYFRGFAERFRENQEGLFDDTNDFILQSLRNQKEMILEDVLRIIEETDPATDRKPSSLYWGNVLRKKVKSIIKRH